MEKQGSLSHWNVKMMPIDIDVTVNQLAQIIGLPMKRISFLKTNDNTSRYALVNGFVNKQEADNFVMKMSDLRISGEPVRCVADPPHLSSQSTTSSSKSFNDIGHQPQSNRGTKNRPNNNNNISSTFVPIMPINTNGRPNFVKDHENKSTESTLPSSHQNQNTAPDIKELNETFQSSNESGQLSSANNSVESKVVDSSEPQPHSSTPYQGRLCSYANKGNCRYKDGECKYRHTRCLNFDSCEKPDCRLAHAKLPSAQTTTQPEIGTSKPCFNGILCYKGDCPFDHPKDWNPCQNGSLCRNYDCIARHPPNYKGRCRNADRCNNKHNCEYLHPIMPSSLPKEPSKIIIELSSAEQNFLENFGKKILDTIREKPDIEDLKIKDGKLQLIGKNLISTNIESYLKQVLHERRITISFSMKKYLELQCKGHLLKKFREKYRVGISYRNSIENASLTTNDMIKLKNRTGNYNQDEQEKQFDNNYDMEQSEDESEDFTDNKSDISNTSSNITSISGKFQHRHPCVQQNIEVNLCTDSEDLISNAIQELGNYTFDIRSLALTQEEVTYILKQSQQPNRFPQKNNKFQSKTLQIKRYIDSLTRSGVNSIVTNFIKYKNGLYFIKVKGFKDHVNNAVSKIKNYLNDHVDTEVQLSISQAMAVYLRTKGSFDLRKLEKTHSVEIKIFSPPFANRMNDEQNDKNDCIKLTGSESRIRAAQINVDNFLESLSEQEKQFPCDSWDAAKFITQTLREKFKKMLDSDDCEAIGWIKVYTPAEKREITPKLTITIVGFNEETVADVVEQCQDIVGGYIIWKPSIDEYRTISNAFFRTKSLSLEEFGRQWNTDIQMDRVTSTITIAAQSKMIAEDIKEALLTLGEENKPRVNRISEFISIQPRIRRFVNQAIASLIEEARYQKIFVDSKNLKGVTLHGHSDIVIVLKEKINTIIKDITQKIIKHHLQLLTIESDLMRANSYELTTRIERETNTSIRDVKIDMNKSASNTNDNNINTILTTVSNSRNQTIVVEKGDITKVKNIDAIIINAASGSLQNAGGIDKAIVNAAGTALVEEYKKIIAKNNDLPISPGKVVKTTAGNLPFTSIIHAYGPQYIDGNQQERPLLFSSVLSSLQLAENECYTSVALAAVGSKTSDFPLTDYINIVVRAVKQFFADNPQSKLKKIILLDIDDAVCNSFAREVIIDHRNEAVDNDDDIMNYELTPLNERLVCGHQKNENTNFSRNIIRYPIVPKIETKTVIHSHKPLDLYSIQTAITKDDWDIIGINSAAITQAKNAIQKAIDSANISEPYSISLGRDIAIHKEKIKSIATQHYIQINFHEEKSGQLSMILKGLKPNVQEAKLKITLYAHDILKMQINNNNNELGTPKEWGEQKEDVKLVEIPTSDPNFTRIEKRMKETMSNIKIHKIQRVQNIRMWSHYAFRRRELKKDVYAIPNLQIEMELFHGTKATPPSEIYNGEFGFDMTFSTSGMWGIGTYFAKNASYSCNSYYSELPDGKRQVFLAQVLTGDVYNCKSDSTMRRAPKKNEGVSGLRYNSVSGDTGGSKVYIVYENRVAYPTYLITFTN
ncbi:unnamed protein product [Adineta steineri]|uniref:Poly [ADP-ribose] polymerase n=2 Tax=Adineta steineri TaxID=433720 RepID=A0A813TDS4_9BILA|nr:unnamed protein product [Adineta steineri]